jgi:hypothetical protein
MMKVKIKQTFRDKENYSLVYAVGEEREFGKSRAQHLIALGLVEPIVDVKEEKEEPIVETQQEKEEPIVETKQEETLQEVQQEETQQEKVQQEEVQQEQAELFAEEENQGKNRKQNKQ